MSSKTRTNGRPALPTTALHALDLYLPAVRRTDDKNFGRNFIVGAGRAAKSNNAWLVCPDCLHWAEVIRGLVQTHKIAGRRCPGSAQLIEFDLTVEQHTALRVAACEWLRAKGRTHPVRPVLRVGHRQGIRRVAAYATELYAEHQARTATAEATAAALEAEWEQLARISAAPAPCQIAAQRARHLAEQHAQPVRRQASATTADAVRAAVPAADCQLAGQDAAQGCARPDRPQLEAGPHTRLTGHVRPKFVFSRIEMAFANPYANADEVIDVAAGPAAAAARAQAAAHLAHAAIARAPRLRGRGRIATVKYRFVQDVALRIGMDDIDSRTVRQAHRLAVAELRDAGQRDLAAWLTGTPRIDRAGAPRLLCATA